MSVLLALLACSGASDGGSDYTAPRTWAGDFLIDTVVIDCDAVEWTYTVGTLGWGDEITVDVRAELYGALVVDEHHALVEVDHDEDSATFALVLDQAGYGEPYESGRATALACDAKTLVTYGFAAWRYDGEMQECIAYGVDPEGLFPDCASWGAGH